MLRLKAWETLDKWGLTMRIENREQAHPSFRPTVFDSQMSQRDGILFANEPLVVQEHEVINESARWNERNDPHLENIKDWLQAKSEELHRELRKNDAYILNMVDQVTKKWE